MKINKDSDDGYALLNWRQPGASRTAGDFALRCHGTTHHDEIYTRLQVPLAVPFLRSCVMYYPILLPTYPCLSTPVLENYRTNVVSEIQR